MKTQQAIEARIAKLETYVKLNEEGHRVAVPAVWLALHEAQRDLELYLEFVYTQGVTA